MKSHLILTVTLGLILSISVSAQDRHPILIGGANGSDFDNGQIFSITDDGQKQVLKTFGFNPDGEEIKSSFLKASDGKIYGTATRGGEGFGVLFRFNTDGTGYQVVHTFSQTDRGRPSSNLVQLADGRLLGMLIFTPHSHQAPRVFLTNTDGTGFQMLSEFPRFFDMNTSLVQTPEGIFGLARFDHSSSNCIFKLNPDGTNFSVVHEFSGISGGVTISPFLLKASNDYLYGNLSSTGLANTGRVYRVKTDGTDFSIVQTFASSDGQGRAGNLVELDGNVYGSIQRASSSFGFGIFKMSFDGTSFSYITEMTDAQANVASGITVTQDGRLLFSINDNAVSNPERKFMLVDKDGANLTTVKSLHTRTFRDEPFVFIDDGTGSFFGVVGSVPTIVKIAINGDMTEVKSFRHPDGIFPNSTLTMLADGFMYGITEAGGEHNRGVIYKIRQDGTGFTVIKNFDTVLPGNYGNSELVLASNGYLYGSSYKGGPEGAGFLYRIKPDGSSYSEIKQFSVAGGARGPVGRLAEFNGKLYGTLQVGVGSLYSIGLDGNNYVIHHNHTCIPDISGLRELAPGVLYGQTVMSSGPQDLGYYYKYDINGGGFAKVFEFTMNFQEAHNSNLVRHEDKLYGLYNENFTNGVLFKSNLDGTGSGIQLNVLGNGGIRNGLTLANDNYLYWQKYDGAASSRIYRSKVGSTQAELFHEVPNDATRAFATIGLLALERTQQQITFPTIGQKLMGTPAFDPGATATSTLPVIYTSSNPTIASIVAGKIQINKAGTVTITAKQAGTPYIEPAELSRTLEVVKNTAVAAISSSNTGREGDVINVQVNRGTSDGDVTYSVVNGTGEASFENNKLTLEKAGTVTVKIAVSETANYNAANAEQAFTIGAASVPHLKITSASSGNAGSNVQLTVDKGASTGAVIFQVENVTGAATLSGASLSLTTPGTVRIKASIAADANYQATTVTQLFTINNPDGTPVADYPRIIGTLVEGGSGNAGTLFQMKADYTNYSALSSFQTHSEGANPSYLKMVEISPGILIGTTSSGGLYNAGVLFRFNAPQQEYTLLYHFKLEIGGVPSGELTLASNGKIYGTTIKGGASNDGTVFSYDPTANLYEKKADFKNNVTGNPERGLIEGSPGHLYGITFDDVYHLNGNIIEFDILAGTLTKRAAIPEGAFPTGYLTLAPNGKMYGLTRMGGIDNASTLFEFDPNNNNFQVKVNFSPNGSPGGGLVLAANNKLYGTLSNGIVEYIPGASDIASHTSVMEPFGFFPDGRMTTGPDGKLYGTTSQGGNVQNGILFSFNPTSKDFVSLRDFEPASGVNVAGAMVAASNGKLYGTSVWGGSRLGGVIFEYGVDGNNYMVKKEFINSTSGFAPQQLLRVDDKLYGSASGGTNGLGVFYEYDLLTGVYTKKIDLNRETGTEVRTPVRHPNGKIYFATEFGNFSPLEPGRVVEFDPASGAVEVVADMASVNGQFVYGVAVAGNGKLYSGVASFEPGIHGLLVELDPVTRTAVTKHQFAWIDGGAPIRLFTGPDGLIYGTGNGGANDGGVLFKFDATDDQLTVLHSFPSNTYPDGRLAFVGGKIYGLTQQGGQHNNGILYEYDLSTSVFTIKKDFERRVSGESLVVGPNGHLIGAINGLPGNASLFEFDPATGTLETKYDFTSAQGRFPIGLIFIKGNQKITFPAFEPKTITTTPFPTGVLASSGLPLSFTSSNPDVATIFENAVIIHGVGETVITASQNGDGNYNPASPVSMTLTVNKGNQTITFNTIPIKTLGNAPFTLTATASSNLPVSFTTTSDKITIAGSQVTLVKAGSITIKANQAGNSNYNPAAFVEQTFCINPEKPSIAVLTGSSKTLGSSNPLGNQWFKDGAEITGAASANYSVTATGSYTVQTTIEGCKSVMSDPTVVEITGLEETSDLIIVYPNPAQDYIFVRPGQASQIHLVDMFGRTLESRNALSGTEERFSVTNLQKGVFFFKIETGGNVVTRKFIKE